MEILQDISFVQVVIAALLGYVAWTVRRALTGFESSVESLGTSIKDLYEKYGKHDSRITVQETIHAVKGCNTVTPP